MEQEYTLTRDPVFYLTAAFFALLTTGLPAVLGQPRFMPLVQAVVLAIFFAIPLRRQHLAGALAVVLIWLVVSMMTIMTLTWLAPLQIERAFENGFFHRAAFSEWYFAGTPLPAGFEKQPVPRLVEILGITLGSLLTAGVVGAWFLMRMANLAAFSAGHLVSSLGGPLLLPVALPVWSVLQIAGAAGLMVLLAEPLFARFAVVAVFRRRRRPLLIFGALYVAGLLAELLLAGLWHFHS